MKYLCLAALLFAILSCRTRSFFQSCRPPVTPVAQSDTVIILTLAGDKVLPDSGWFIGTADSRIGISTLKQGFDSVIRYTRAEARKLGGNVLKLTTADIRFMHLQMIWGLYYLPPRAFANFLEMRDSARNAFQASLQGRAIVHLINRGSGNPSDIYIGDSLLTTLNGVGYSGHRRPGKATLRFDRPGRLVFSGDAGHLDFVTGKEYYVVLYSLGGSRYVHITYHYALTDADGFENELLMNFHSP